MSSLRFPTDYDQYAPSYAWTRQAVPWVLIPLVRETDRIAAGSTVLEAGCGTGNYIRALADHRADLAYLGFDLSEPMLQEARTHRSSVQFRFGDASERFPCENAQCALVFVVDVVHHLTDLRRFFLESARVLQTDGALLVVTDSVETMRQRSLTRHFPEILRIERQRYPEPCVLHANAEIAGLRLVGEEAAIGDIPLSDDFVERLQAKCSSAMRLLTPEAHAVGMTRVRQAQAMGQAWRSHYVVLHYSL
jgi:SAM-dependent methyltransferase